MNQFMPFPGYNPGSETTEHEQLPCAGYIGRIENARIEETPNSKSLCLTLDIAEGHYAGWFRNDYERRKGGKYPACRLSSHPASRAIIPGQIGP